MNILETIKDNKQSIRVMLYRGCILVVAVMTFKIVAYAIEPESVTSGIELAKKKYQIDDDDRKAYQEKYSKAADELKKTSHLIPKAAKPTLPTCTGVIGNKALINGKLYSVGEQVLGAMITDISPTGATIIWEGKPTQIAAFGKLNLAKSDSSDHEKQKDDRHRFEEHRRPEPDVSAMPGPMRRPEGGGFMGMSREQIDEMRQRFMNMSSEERQKFIEQKRAEFGFGRGGPGGGGPGGGPGSGRGGSGGGDRGPGGGDRGGRGR